MYFYIYFQYIIHTLQHFLRKEVKSQWLREQPPECTYSPGSDLYTPLPHNSRVTFGNDLISKSQFPCMSDGDTNKYDCFQDLTQNSYEEKLLAKCWLVAIILMIISLFLTNHICHFTTDRATSVCSCQHVRLTTREEQIKQLNCPHPGILTLKGNNNLNLENLKLRNIKITDLLFPCLKIPTRPHHQLYEATYGLRRAQLLEMPIAIRLSFPGCWKQQPPPKTTFPCLCSRLPVIPRIPNPLPWTSLICMVTFPLY